MGASGTNIVSELLSGRSRRRLRRGLGSGRVLALVAAAVTAGLSWWLAGTPGGGSAVGVVDPPGDAAGDDAASAAPPGVDLRAVRVAAARQDGVEIRFEHEPRTDLGAAYDLRYSLRIWPGDASALTVVVRTAGTEDGDGGALVQVCAGARPCTGAGDAPPLAADVRPGDLTVVVPWSRLPGVRSGADVRWDAVAEARRDGRSLWTDAAPDRGPGPAGPADPPGWSLPFVA